MQKEENIIEIPSEYLKEKAALYPPHLPESIDIIDTEDALINGIYALSEKLINSENKSETSSSSPLEVARIELTAKNETLRHNVRIEREKLRKEAISGAILQDAMAELEQSIAHKIDFGTSTALTGKHAASLIRGLVDSM